MADYNIGLGIEDRFSSVLKNMQFQMATVQHATADSVKEIEALERSASKLQGVNAQFQGLANSVRDFSNMAKAGYAPKIMFDDMTASLQKARESVISTTPEIDKVASSMQTSGQAAQNAGTSFGQMFIAMGAGSLIANVLLGALNSVKSALMSIPQQAIAVNAAFEQTRVAFTTLLESGEKADAFLKQLWQFAATTPFEFPELTQAAQRMKAFGFATEEILPLMEAVGNITSALGGSSEIVGRMTYNLGQMKAMGKVTGRELRDLAMAGVNLGDVYNIIAKKMGKTTAEIKNILSSARGASGIDIDIFLEAFKEVGTSGKFLGAMEAQAKTFNGAMSTIRDNMTGLVRDGFKPAFEWVSKLVYQFSLFAQGEQFTRITTALAASMKQLTGNLPVIGVDSFAPLVEGALKAIDVFTKLATFVKDNLTPIIVGLGVAATLTLAAITVALAGATGGLSLVIPTIAAGIALLTKAILDSKKAESEHQVEINKTADALGKQGERYKWLAAQIAELEKRTAGRGKEGLVNQKDLDLLDQYRAERMALEDQVREAQTESWRAYQEGMATALKGYVYEVPVLPSPLDMFNFWAPEKVEAAQKRFTDAAEKAQVVWNDAMDSIRQVAGNTFVKVGEAAVGAGEKTVAWLNNLAQSVGLTREPLENVRMLIEAIGKQASVLGVDAQAAFAAQVGSIMKTLKSAGDYGHVIESLRGLLDNVTAATKKAADAQKWKDLFDEITKGVKGPMEAYYKALATPQVLKYDISDFSDKQYQIAQKQRKLLEMEEQYRRMVGTSVVPELNWKTAPAAGELAMFRLEMDKVRREIQGGTDDLGRMEQANADVANSGVKAFEELMQAEGKLFLQQIRNKEKLGDISKSQADALVAQTEETYGVQESLADKYLQAQTQIKEKLGVMGAETLSWWLDANAKAMAAKDPVAEITRLADEKLKKDKEITAEAERQKKLWKQLGESQDETVVAVGDQKTAQETLNTVLTEGEKKFISMNTLASDLLTALTTMTGKEWLIKIIVSAGGGGGAAHNEGDPAGPGLWWHQVPPGSGNWQAVPWLAKGLAPTVFSQPTLIGVGEAGPEMVSVTPLSSGYGPRPIKSDLPGGNIKWMAAGTGNDPAQNTTTSAQHIVEEIQRMLGLFAGLSIDPRVKDMADTVSSVVGALRSGIEALASLKDFIAPARSAVDIAFAEMTYIHGRMQDYLLQFVGAFDNEKLGDVAGMARTFLDTFASGVAALMSLKDYTAPARAAIDSALSDMMYVVQEFVNKAPTFDQEVLVAAKQLAETIGAIGSALSSAADGMIAASDFPKLKADRPFANIGDAIWRWMRGFVELSEKYNDPKVLDAIKKLAETVSVIGDALSAVVEPMAAAAKFKAVPAGGFAPLADAIERWIKGMAHLKTKIEGGGFKLADAQMMAKTVGEVGSALSAIVAPLVTLADSPLTGKVAKALETADDVVRKVLEQLRVWATGSVAFGRGNQRIILPGKKLYITDEMKAMATAISETMQPFQAIVQTVEQVVALADKVGASGDKLTSALTVIDDVVRKLVNQIRLWTEGKSIPFGRGNQRIRIIDPIEITDSMQDFALSLSTLLAPMQTVIGITTGMLDLAQRLTEGTVTLEAAILTLDAVTRSLVFRMKDWEGSLSLGAKDAEGNYTLVAYAEALGKVLAPMQTVIGITTGMLDLAKRVAEGVDPLGAAMTVMNDAVQRLVLQMKQWWFGSNRISLGPVTAEGEYVLVTFAENLGKLLAPFSTIISISIGALDLAKRVADGTESLSAAIVVMDDATKRLVLKMKQWWFGSDRISLGPVTEEGEYVLITFAENLSKLLAPFQTIISITTGMLDLAQRLVNSEGSLATAFTTLDTVTRDLVAKMKAWAMDTEGMSITTAMTDYAEKLGKVLAPFQTAISVISGLLDYAQKARHSTAQIATILPQFFLDLQLIIQTFVDTRWPDVAGITDDMLAKISNIVNVMNSSVTLLTSLREYARDAHTESVDIPAAITAIVDNLQLAITEYVAKISTIKDIDKIESETVTTVNNIVSALSNAVGLFAGLQKFKRIPLATLQDFVSNLQEAIHEFMIQIVNVPEAVGLADPETSIVAQTVQTIVGALGAAVEFFNLLRGYADIPQTLIRIFMEDLAYTVGQFIATVLPPIEAAGAENVEKVGNAVKAIVEGLTAAVDFFKALETYNYVAPKIIDNFFAQLVSNDDSVLQRFKVIVALLQGPGYTDVDAIATSIQNIVGSLNSTLEFLKSLKGFTGVEAQSMADVFLALVGGTGANNKPVKGLLDYIQEANAKLTGEAQAAISTFSGAVGSINSSVSGALDVLARITTYSAPLPAKFQQFVNDLIGGGSGAATTMGVLGAIAAVAAAWNANAATAATTFKDAVESIKQPIADAMAVLTAIRTGSTIPIANINSFIAAMNGVLLSLQALSGTAAGLNLTDLVSKLGTISTTIVSTLNGMSELWRSAGESWITNLIAGMTANEDDLLAYLTHIRALLPSSPAKEGPLHEPVDWNNYLTMGLQDASRTLSNELGRMQFGGASAAVPAVAGGGQTINIDLSGSTISNQADEDRLIRKLTDALRRQGVAL